MATLGYNLGRSAEPFGNFGLTIQLAAIDQLQELRGVAFPVEYKVRQLIVTGPPGSGKSTLM